MARVVFLDRDGTMLEEMGYLTPWSTARMFPWTIDALRLLARAGFALVVVTNQGGVGRGLYSEEFVEETHRRLAARCEAAGVRIDAWLHCPHHPDALIDRLRGPCECRKPGLGLVRAAASRLAGGCDVAHSWTVGDSWRDVQLGHAMGGRSILVRTGHGARQEQIWPREVAPPAFVCDNLMAAAATILREAPPCGGTTRRPAQG